MGSKTVVKGCRGSLDTFPWGMRKIYLKPALTCTLDILLMCSLSVLALLQHITSLQHPAWLHAPGSASALKAKAYAHSSSKTKDAGSGGAGMFLSWLLPWGIWEGRPEVEHSLSARRLRRSTAYCLNVLNNCWYLTIDWLNHSQDNTFCSTGLEIVLEWGCSEVTELHPGPKASSHLHFQIGQWLQCHFAKKEMWWLAGFSVHLVCGDAMVRSPGRLNFIS